MTLKNKLGNAAEKRQSGLIKKYLSYSPPSLFIKDKTNEEGHKLEMQLIGKSYDGDRITYALEPPILKGMVIDPLTGKIIWTRQYFKRGEYKITASVSSSSGLKTTKTFNFTIHNGRMPPKASVPR